MSNNKSLDLVAVNQWLHSPQVWAPWPDFLVAFASNGCGDYFAYDMRQSPPSIIYIDPDATPEENLADPEALRYSSFGEWYESQLERYTCQRCGSREVRVLRHRKTGAGFCGSALAVDLRSPPTPSSHDLAEQIHWSECGRAMPVRNSDALGRPHRSVLALDLNNTHGDF